MLHRDSGLVSTGLLALSILAASSSIAAEYEPGEKTRTSVHMGSGVAGLLHENINKELESAGFSELENPYVPFAVSMLNYSGRLAFGLGINFLFHVRDELEREDYRGKAFAMAAALRLGYEAVALEDFSLTPLIGVGMSDVTLSFYSKDSQRFDAALDQQAGGVVLEGIGLLLDFALRLEYRLTLSERENGRLDLAIGLVGGFSYTPAVFSWAQSSFGEVKDGPDFGVTGPYGLITLGIARSSFPVKP